MITTSTMIGGQEDERGQRFLGLLDLPRHSSITIDGEPLVLKRPDFVGFVNLPAEAAATGGTSDANVPSDGDRAAAGFHFVSVRAASRKDGDRSDGTSTSSVAVGFAIPQRGHLVRRYDPATEEVSPHPVDSFTEVNLLRQLRDGRVDPHRFADYAKLLGPSKEASWRELTGCITPRLLRRRGIEMGDKIVPGAYQAEDQDDEDPMTDPRKQMDGTSIAYPPVPVLLASASGDSRHRHRSLARHAGTRRFLSGLGPGQRTALATEPSPPARVLEAMLRDYYGGSWRDLVGDVQLSFLLFLHLHCFASLSHWRDLVAMLSCVEPRALRADLQDTAIGTLYPGLLETLSRQVTAVDPDFFDDAELSGENELVPSLRRLLQMRPQAAEGNGGVGGSASSPSLAALESARARLEEVLQQRFPSVFANDADGAGGADEAMGDDSPHVGEEDDVEEDGPAVVAGAEVDASLARIAAESAARGGGRRTVEYPAEIRGRFPLLFAAMLPAEDAVMTCARALDDANDASLVREAADYLQQVEARVGRDGGSAESCSS